MKSLLTNLTLAAILVPVVLFASEPYPIPANQLAPAVTPVVAIPSHVAPRPLPDPSGPMTIERLDHSSARGAIYYSRRDFLLQQQSAAALDAALAFQTATPSNESAFKVGALAAVGTTLLASNDSNQDAETSVAAVKIGTTDYTMAASIKYIINGTQKLPRNHVSYSANFGAFSVPVQLALPAGYTVSADPLFSVNPYTGGIAPKRAYCVGVLTTPGASVPSAIGVWRSDNGGQTWAGPTIVASRPAGGHYLDKPAITVSWHNATLGYVYVAFVDRDEVTATNTSLLVYRSTDGGLTFPTFNAVVIDDVQGPQLAVNPNNGTLHCMWLNNPTNDIRSAYTINNNLGFSAHEVAVSGGNLLTYLTGTTLTGNVRAMSLPMARFNWVAGRVMMVYHAWNATHTDTDVFYTYRPCSVNCNGFNWEVPQRVNDVTTRDQFFPGIDFSSAGNVVVTFYDRRADATNIRYEEYFAYINSSGGALQANTLVSAFQTDPRLYTSATGAASFIGDYQDAWDWTYSTGGESIASTWIGIPSAGAGNNYVTRITY